jgi:chromosome partitioning protein
MKTVSLINQKGGVGKTTLALHLATAFWQKGNNVLVLDLDPQASATEWHDARAEKFPHVESIQPARLPKAFESARDIGTDILILDTAPHSEATALDAARRADLVLVPCQPSIMDIRAMRKTVDVLNLINVPSFAILNSVPGHGQTTADDAASTIETAIGLPMCPVRLGDRVAYNRCLITGQAAQEYEPQGKAATEIEQLYAWTCEQLRIPISDRAAARARRAG